MRVALNGLFLSAPATGTGQYLRELVRALRVQSPADEFIFVAPHADPGAPAPVLANPTRLSGENLAKFEFEQITFPRATRNDFDVRHIPHFGPPLFPARPTVVTIHDLIPIVLPAYRGSPLVRLYTRLAAAGARRAQAILADSFASARDIETHLQIPRDKIAVVHLAADARFRLSGRNDLEHIRSKLNLPERFVLYLGGFDVRKNVRRVFEAFAGLTSEMDPDEESSPKIGLVVAGTLPEKDSAFFPDPRRIAKSVGVGDRVQFVGFVLEQDKPALYAAARVLLFPSRYEGFGLPALEAMACGTPVIASNSSSLPEVVGNAGILLDADDVSAWREALRALVFDNSRWNELRERGIAAAKKFSWERAAQETLRVYRSVV